MKSQIKYLLTIIFIILFVLLITYKFLLPQPNQIKPTRLYNLSKLTVTALNSTYSPKARIICNIKFCEIADKQDLSRQKFLNLYNQLYNDKTLETVGWKLIDNSGSDENVFRANYEYDLKNRKAHLTKTLTVPPATLLNQPDNPKTTAPFQLIYQIQ